MKNLAKSIRLTFILCGFLGISYVLVLWIFALCATPQGGAAEQVKTNGKVVGMAHVGQTFTKDIYFWGRPSCAGDGYDATRSGGSNKAASNMVYLTQVEHRINDFIRHHPYLKRKDIPAEMVTASGSGLDPDISPRSAYIQARRIAKARNCDVEVVKAIIANNIEKPLMGQLGPEHVNVLRLNIDLDKIVEVHDF
jgi:K+-transporting ATPase ATPase C chain